MKSYSDELILQKIEKQLENLEVKKRKLLKQKQSILDGFQSLSCEHDELPKLTVKLTTEEKINLFQRLFRGIEDVFAVRWQNKQGRSGYSVACRNEWVPHICNKPKIKCSDCTFRSFKTLNKEAIYDHLS